MKRFSSDKHMRNSFPSSKITIIVGVLVFVLVYTSFVYFDIGNYTKQVNNTAIDFSESASAFLTGKAVLSLQGDSTDLNNPLYIDIKNGLMQLREDKTAIQAAYLLSEKNDRLYILADGEHPDTTDYSPPGQDYPEAAAVYYEPFQDGKTIVTGEVADRWGTWVSVLLPIRDTQTGKIIATFGIDYSASEWNSAIMSRVIQDALIGVCLLLVIVSLHSVFRKNKSLRQLSENLASSEKLFRSVFDQAPVGIAVVEDFWNIVMINPEFEKILGKKVNESSKLDWGTVTHPDDYEEDIRQFSAFRAGEIDGYSMEKRYVRPDNSSVWVNMQITRLSITKDDNLHHLCIVQDIQASKLANAALLESERSKAVLLSNLPGMAYRCNYDKEWTMHFLSDGCFELTGYKPENLINNKDLSFNDLIVGKYREVLWKEWEIVLPNRKPFRYEYEITTASRELKWVLELGQGVFDSAGNVEALEGIVIDITELKLKEEHIQYANDHDAMTGLFNRRYFEDAKIRLDAEGEFPFTILVGDINGVRLINDAFGQAEGDKLIIEVARIMKCCCREGDLVARTGGDEFSVLLPNADQDIAHQMMDSINGACARVSESVFGNAQYINISIGYASKHSALEGLSKVEKDAEDSMNRRKLLARNSYHNAMLSSIMVTLFENSHETEEHAQRLSHLCKMIGEKMHLSQKNMDELQLFSMLHDIGKIGIDDSILNKPGPLSKEEWEIMRTHPEIGYRIAMSSPDLVPIAEYILTHHERWDGKGYPQGLKGIQIPLLSRVLAVSDSYDAMTEDRVYHEAIPKEMAIKEIENNIGTQFDPEIARIFIDNIREYSK